MPQPAEILPVAAAAGELLLRCGANVDRVEDTVARIAQAYGIAEVATFATPTGLFVALGTGHHTATVCRVRERTMALDRVSALNALSRELAVNPLPPEEALRRIQAIAAQPGPLPTWTDVAFSGLAAAACTMLVGGALSDFGPALVANLFVQGTQRLVRRMHTPDAIGDFLAGAGAVLCAVALSTWVGSAFAPVVAGGIMVLVPGTAFTASVRDAMAGDLVSSGARGLEAAVKAAALASGVAAALYVTGRL